MNEFEIARQQAAMQQGLVYGTTKAETPEATSALTGLSSSSLRERGFLGELVYEEDIKETYRNLSPEDKLKTAYVMYDQVVGAYGGFADIFDEDGNVDEENFLRAWQVTREYAGASSSMGELGSATPATSKYVDILMNQTDMDTREVVKNMRKQQSAEFLQSVDVAALREILKNELSGLIGRGATDKEERNFIQLIRKSVLAGDAVSYEARAREFGREQMGGEVSGTNRARIMGGLVNIIRGGGQ